MERIEETCPIRGTHSRLHQTHRLWHQVQQEYDNPEGFCTNLNAAIQALRSVTFVLQKEQRAIPEFDAWYAAWQARLKQDPQMVWLVQARNHIEKEGDLDTYSSARVALLADWHDSQPLVELQVPPLTTTQEILSKLPELHLPAYVLQEGLLEIERRWVVRDLPDKELLEVLAHCYGVLATLVRSAHHQCGFSMRTFRSDSHEAKPVRTEHLEGRLPCMVATREMRTERLHLGIDAFMTPAQLFVPADPRRKEETLARYGSTVGELAIQPSEDIIEAAARWFEKAKRVLVTNGYHLPLVLLVMPDGAGTLHFLDLPDRQALYVTMRQIANEVERLGAVGVIHVAEFWMAPADIELQSGQRVGDLADRREGLTVTVSTADGRQRVHMVEFWKDENGRITLGNESVLDEVKWLGTFEPIRQVWRMWHEKAGSRTTDQS